MKGELFALPFWFIERNANIRRNTLSDCVFLGSRTFKYAPRRKALSFASCLYLRVLTGDGFAWNGRNANIRRNTLSPLRFAPLCNGAAPLTSCLPFLTKGRCRAERDGGDKKIVDDMGRDLTRDFFGKNRTDNPSVSCADSSPCTREPRGGGCGVAPTNHASPFGKGRWCEAPEGIRKPDFDKINRSADMNPQKGRHLLCTFCPCEKRKQGETSGNAAREERNRQSAAWRVAGVCPVKFSADSR